MNRDKFPFSWIPWSLLKDACVRVCVSVCGGAGAGGVVRLNPTFFGRRIPTRLQFHALCVRESYRCLAEAARGGLRGTPRPHAQWIFHRSSCSSMVRATGSGTPARAWLHHHHHHHQQQQQHRHFLLLLSQYHPSSFNNSPASWVLKVVAKETRRPAAWKEIRA